jgi:hypothetical protein
LRKLVLLVTAAAYFAAAFLGQKLKLKILCEKLLITSQRFFGIPPFRFYALADGIKNSHAAERMTKRSPRFPAIPQGMPRLGQSADWEQAQRFTELGGNRNWVFGGRKA